IAQQRGIVDAASDKLNLSAGDQRLEAADIGRVGDGVDHRELVVRTCSAPRVNQVLADETGPTADQNASHQSPISLQDPMLALVTDNKFSEVNAESCPTGHL